MFHDARIIVWMHRLPYIVAAVLLALALFGAAVYWSAWMAGAADECERVECIDVAYDE